MRTRSQVDCRSMLPGSPMISAPSMTTIMKRQQPGRVVDPEASGQRVSARPRPPRIAAAIGQRASPTLGEADGRSRESRACLATSHRTELSHRSVSGQTPSSASMRPDRIASQKA